MDNRGNISADAMATNVADLILDRIKEMKDDFREDLRELKAELKEEIKEVNDEVKEVRAEGKRTTDRLTELESKFGEYMDREPTGAGQASKKEKKSLKEQAPVIASSIGGGAGIMALLDYLAGLINKAGH